jgi:hypothetical protein
MRVRVLYHEDDERELKDPYFEPLLRQPRAKKVRALAVLFGVWMAAGAATAIVLWLLERVAAS